MNVEFTYTNGKQKLMPEAYAKVLEKMKLGTYTTTAIPRRLNRAMQTDLIPAAHQLVPDVVKKTSDRTTKRRNSKVDDGSDALDPLGTMALESSDPRDSYNVSSNVACDSSSAPSSDCDSSSSSSSSD